MILENANFSLIALKVNVPPSLQLPSKATPPEDMYAHRSDDQRQHYYNTSCVIHRWENFIVQLVKVLQYQERRSGCWCLPAILALSAQCTWTRCTWHILSAQTGCAEVCKITCWQAGRKANRNARNERFDWTKNVWSYAFHRIYKYI